MVESEKILLILDLDETLIHATESVIDFQPSFRFSKYNIYPRPFLLEFLTEATQYFKLAIWSSADDEYVDEVVKLVKPSNIVFEFVWARSRCTTRRNIELDKYVHEKRLKKVKKLGYTLERVLIVDDSPEKTRENFGNAIYIQPFEGAKDDDELLRLIDFLKSLSEKTNVRRIEKRGWRNKSNAHNKT